MKKILFAVAALVVVACQQNTPKETTSAEEENAIVLTSEEPFSTEVDNDWKEMKLKGKVKVLTKILRDGIYENGRWVKDEGEIPLVIRTFFNSQGFITFSEEFSGIPIKLIGSPEAKPTITKEYRYNEKGQLSELIISRNNTPSSRYVYLYNEQGDQILERSENSIGTETGKKEYHYQYTPEGKQKTYFLEDMKVVHTYTKRTS
jgi:lipoprotein